MEPTVEYRRLYWHSRRGMLELDLLLLPFVRECLPHLDAADRYRYRCLLEREDRELHGWLLGGDRPRDHDLADIVAKILAHTRVAD